MSPAQLEEACLQLSESNYKLLQKVTFHSPSRPLISWRLGLIILFLFIFDHIKPERPLLLSFSKISPTKVTSSDFDSRNWFDNFVSDF